ncbi:tachykinin-2 [Plakobranchus ocellatus]|uniref:Tachykinin-2 n=1 Tax=Plakobranchus ocellatus TaxID=259542 RepID=A0AAV4A7C3_9GAST|nr:tachykinin-2 [Plakobranchus ocellatus]
MLNFWKIWWRIGATALSLTLYACASSLDESETIIKESLWLPVAEENLNDPGWTDNEPSKAMFQPSEVDDYSVNPEKIVVVDDGAHTLGGQPEGSSPRGAVDDGSARASLRLMLRSIFSTLDNDRRSRQGLTAVNQVATKKAGPRGYFGSRGKRFMPELESLLLAKYYQGMTRQGYLFNYASFILNIIIMPTNTTATTSIIIIIIIIIIKSNIFNKNIPRKIFT